MVLLLFSQQYNCFSYIVLFNLGEFLHVTSHKQVILGIVAGLLSKRYPLFPALSLVDSRYFFNDVYFVPSSLNFIKNTPNVRFFCLTFGV